MRWFGFAMIVVLLGGCAFFRQPSGYIPGPISLQGPGGCETHCDVLPDGHIHCWPSGC